MTDGAHEAERRIRYSSKKSVTSARVHLLARNLPHALVRAVLMRRNVNEGIIDAEVELLVASAYETVRPQYPRARW